MITVITGVTYDKAHKHHYDTYGDPPLFNLPECHKTPSQIVRWAKDVVRKNDNFRVITLNSDVVSSIRYISEFYGKESEFILVGADGIGVNHGLNIEPLFKEFNKAYDLLDKYNKD